MTEKQLAYHLQREEKTAGNSIAQFLCAVREKKFTNH
jgi:hypothetical protein